ncbi:Transposase InsO and inactivated derivatives [Dolosicoccus paucivorans]|nr:Transposase InsO and inactivated derivatives [Dolosicoccus paucivorans]
MPKSSYYEWRQKLDQVNKEEVKLIQRMQEIIQKANGSYGYRRVCLAVKQLGYTVNHKRVLRLMKENYLLCTKFTRRSRKKYSFYQGEVGKVAANHLERQFNPSQINEVWVSDVTEFAILNDQRKLYLSPIMDLFNSEIIACSLSVSPTIQFTNQALDQVLAQLPKHHQLMIHTDQGLHYQHHSWVEQLESRGIQQSMSRKGNCLDNSPMENFFGLLKQEMFYGETFESIDHLALKIKEYIEWYNHDRIKTKLNGLSPVKYRQQAA